MSDEKPDSDMATGGVPGYARTRKNHPDLHAINDWAMYGPNNAEIERLVAVLTLDHGMRLAKVENAIVEALKGLIATLEED